MLYNMRKLMVVSAGSFLMLTVSLWLLGFTPSPANQLDVSKPTVPVADSAPAVALPAQTTLEISSTVRLTETKRLGMNLGGHVERGGSYLLKNLIRNPGFEAGEYNMIFLAQPGATATRVQANWGPNGLTASQPISFWNGAAYEIISGTASLRNGTVISFTHENGNDTFYLAEAGPAPATGNVIMVSQTITGYCCPIPSPFREADTSDVRPGSPGAQSLRLRPRNPGAPDSCQDADGRPSWSYLVDSFWRQDANAGKLFIADGNWHFAIWARGAHDGDQLTIRFRRQGLTDFFHETVTLTTEWQHIVREFAVSAGEDAVDQPESCPVAPALLLSLHVPANPTPPNDGPVWVDDIELTRSGQTTPTVFSDKVVARLQELRPGLLRNWGMEQLGSTLDNQLAEPWARRTNGYQPDLAQATQWHYSIHEFLQLTELIDAEPWYVIPPTFSAAELQNLVAYLAAPSDAHPYAEIRSSLGQTEPWTAVFSTIHLELGNEMWGGLTQTNPFLGASVGGPIINGLNSGQRLGQVAHNRFAIMRNSPFFTADHFELLIGSQAGFPTRTLQIESSSDQHDNIALAPYFYMDNLPTAWANDEERFYPLFAWPRQDVQAAGRVGLAHGHIYTAGQGTELAVYEINFHTTGGAIPLDVRNDLVTSQGGGLALSLFMLTYQREMGIRNQNVWRLAAFSNPVVGARDEYVQLFGALRDLEATGRKRPTWLGVELANRAIGGDLLKTNFTAGPPTWVQTPMNGINSTIELPLLQAFAYRDGNQYAVILFNLDLNASHVLALRLPSPPQATATLHTLTATDIYTDNEEGEHVQIMITPITDFAQNYQLTLTPHSAYVLEWQAEAPQPALYLPIMSN